MGRGRRLYSHCTGHVTCTLIRSFTAASSKGRPPDYRSSWSMEEKVPGVYTTKRAGSSGGRQTIGHSCGALCVAIMLWRCGKVVQSSFAKLPEVIYSFE